VIYPFPATRQQPSASSAKIAAVQSLGDYIPRPGLSVPIVTILDARGRILEDQQRAVIRFAFQDGAGADIIFAAGTTGEWDRIDNSRRQAVARIAIEECRRARESAAKKIEAWAGITAHTRSDTLDNLNYAIHAGADAVVVAPLSIKDVEHPADFVERDIGAVSMSVRSKRPSWRSSGSHEPAKVSARSSVSRTQSKKRVVVLFSIGR